jgi:glycosyltransferase involved in cell wall biosynthesis
VGAGSTLLRHDTCGECRQEEVFARSATAVGVLNPLVSIIVPTYNYAHFLRSTLACVRAQTYPHWECVVVDDGSTDETAAVVADFVDADTRVRYVHQRNQGLGPARNMGLRASEGQYIQFLDSDDLIEQRKLEKSVGFLEVHQEYALVYSDSAFFAEATPDGCPLDQTISEISWVPRVPQDKSHEELVLALLRMPFPPHSPLLRRSVVDSVGSFEEAFTPCQDWHFWIRTAIAGHRFAYLPAEGSRALYRRHAGSMTTDRRLLVEGLWRLRREFDRLLRNPEARALNRQLRATAVGQLAILDAATGQRLRASWHCIGAAALHRQMRERLKWIFLGGAALVARPDRFEEAVYSSIGQALRNMRRPPATAID